MLRETTVNILTGVLLDFSFLFINNQINGYGSKDKTEIMIEILFCDYTYYIQNILHKTGYIAQ